MVNSWINSSLYQGVSFPPSLSFHLSTCMTSLHPLTTVICGVFQIKKSGPRRFGGVLGFFAFSLHMTHCNDSWGISNKKVRTSSVWWRIGFHRIFTVAFERLLLVKLGWVKINNCPAVVENWPCKVRAPAGATNRKKACENAKKPKPTRSKSHDIFLFLQIFIFSLTNSSIAGCEWNIKLLCW